ncbi:TAXI family TRAP transporter solute-binding subunit [Paracoccus sp. (in: a-proteobacteria)]|uniref:TAXI family TRAP transporter solute-binding subunit n=1 Tax=Paracoccus sp. TaxID=267 RepID=UPI0026E059EE|nr:TAXI family TRAP transporter solute-binding subunit [Paracoccus sp. (in: a-proteobacteria)]MDO5370081.1 TAXI family TRAP transporter solute-binding subunit [Paracoccus sp. (in: a-proteobacteria)]
MSKTRWLGMALGAVLALATGPAAAQQEFGKAVMTGGASGTYIQIGRDLAGLMAQCGQTLNVIESAGSLENFMAVRQRSNTQFGIVQNDVLEYLKTYSANDPDVARAIYNVRIAFPLYDEEVHLLATSDIDSLADLAGKRVAIGVENSGTFLTASLVLDLTGTEPAERRLISPADALPALKAGEIDAFFYVAGAPTALFAEGEIDGERFQLVPITDQTLGSVYDTATIPANTYPFQPEAVEGIAVKALLMTFEYDPRGNGYQQQSCKAVSDLSHLMLTRLPQLQESGHPKWKNVDLQDIPPGWDIGNCVNQGLQPDYQLQCATPLATATAPEERPAQPAESEANRAYREYICATLGC